MITTKKNAPDMSGNSVEGEDPNTHQGEQINMNTTPTVSDTTDIHPEIPRAPWVTERYLDDDGRCVVDEHDYDDGDFHINRSVSHSIDDDGTVRTNPENYFVAWLNRWPDSPAIDSESVTILPRDLPRLIAVLQRLQAEAPTGTDTAGDKLIEVTA